MDQEYCKTILYIGGFELPDKNAAAQRVVTNAKILKMLGYNVVFVGIDKSRKDKYDIKDTESIVYGFTSYSIKYPKSLKDWRYYLSDISYLIELMKDVPSVVIAYNYPALALFRLNSYCKKCNIPVIADCTEWYEPQGSIIFKTIKGLDTFFRMRVLHPKLDGMIAISEYLYNFYSLKMKNVILLPPLVDKKQEKWCELKSESNERNTVDLVYAGSVGTGNKDRLDLIIDALALVYKRTAVYFKFTILGLTLDQYCNVYSVDGLPDNICDKISFKGRVSHIDALNTVCNSDFEIFLRDNNIANTAGFPTKFVESISCGTPVLTNLSTNLGVYLKNDFNGYILDNSSLECLADSLLVPLSMNKKSINKLKDNCKESDLFDFRNYVEKFGSFMSLVDR
nr:glycosyltransferase [uncultured Bacteroides sp.]